MPQQIVPITADDETALRAWHDVDSAAHLHDVPGDPPPRPNEKRAILAAPWPHRHTRAWLALADGEPAGVALSEFPTRENLATAPVRIVVRPSLRRRSIGRELAGVLSAEARADGRVRLLGEARSPLGSGSAGTAFAESLGAVPAQVVIQRRLDVTAMDDAVLDRLAGPAAPGYELVRWTGDTPREWLDDVARLEGRMTLDAPQGELHWEPESYDAERVRERDVMCRLRGWTVLTTAAVGQDGRLAGYTEIGLDAPDDELAATWNTLVLAEHRGRRLGLRVKLANLAYLRRTFPGCGGSAPGTPPTTRT